MKASDEEDGNIEELEPDICEALAGGKRIFFTAEEEEEEEDDEEEEEEEEEEGREGELRALLSALLSDSMRGTSIQFISR